MAESGRGGRRPGVLLLAVGIAVAAGTLATLLEPSAPPQPSVSTTGGISVPVPDDATPPDPRVARDRLLQQLVVDARSEPRPTLLPAYEALAIPCRRGQPSCDEVVERLGEPDAPLRLVSAFARELRRTDRARLDTLLGPLLRSEDPERVELAIDLYREHTRAAVATDAGCGCGFGVVPTPLGAEAFLFAESPTGGLAWEPEETDEGWILRLRRDPEGARRLVRPVTLDGAALTVLASEGGARLQIGTKSTTKEPGDGNP